MVNISLLATGFIFSQDCDLKLEGKIIDLYSDSPLEAAVIEVVGTNTNTISTADGLFTLTEQCPKKIKLKISHLNCKDLFTEIDLRQSESLSFYMDHHVESLDEVVVAEEKTNNLSTTAKIYSLSESEKDRNSHDGLTGVLEQLSGVHALSSGNNIAKPVIHGMFGSRIGIIYNGIMLENQQWGQDHAPNVDVNAFNNIRVIKGASALKYTGSNPGGIVILQSSFPKKIDSLYGKTILSGMSNGKGASLVSSWTRSFQNGTYFTAQGTIKKSGDLSAPNYVLSNTGYNQKNVSLAFGKNDTESDWKIYFSYFNNETGILKSSHIGNVGDLLRAIESDKPIIINPFSYQINNPKQLNTHYTTSIDYSKYLNDKQKLSLKYSWQKNNRKEYDLRRGAFKNTASLHLNLDTHHFNSNYEWTSSFAEVNSGLFFEIQNNFSTPGTGTKRLIPDYLKTRFGSYITAIIHKNKNFDFGLGLRHEYLSNDVHKYYHNIRWESENYGPRLGPYVINEVLSQKLVKRKIVFNTFSFNAGVVFKASKGNTLGVQYNYVQRAPDIAEMFSDGLHHSLASIEYGNPFLKKETTQKLLLDFEKKYGFFTYSISPYITLGKNFIIIEQSGFEQSIRGAFPVWEYVPINAIFKGVDLDLSYKINRKLRLRNNTSWVEAVNSDTKEPLVNIPALTIKNQVEFSIPNWERFHVSVISKNVFHQHLFPNNNNITSTLENGKKVDKVVDISTPPDGYMDLGLDLNWGPYQLFSININISLSFDNILNTRYRNYLNRLRFYSDDKGRNVMLQLKIKH